jgi:hypothetical protein
MKNKLTFCGFIISIALITAVSASNTEPLAAFVAQFRIVVDGVEQSFENPIVTINDRTYIPLREIGEVLGMDVEWDGENREIIINSSQMLESDNNESEPDNLLTSQSNETEWDTLYEFEQDGLWGYKDSYDNVIIEPQFRIARRFSEGLAFVDDDAEQRGYIDLSGNLVISLPTGRYPSEFSQGFAGIVLRDWNDDDVAGLSFISGPVVFIDRTGENIFGMEFLDVRSFTASGLAVVQLLDETFARIDTSGNIVATGDWLRGIR